MRDWVNTIAATLAIVALMFGAWFFIDGRYALCAEVKRLERRLDYKIENDRYMGMQQRAWQMESQFPDMGRAPQAVRDQHRELRHDLDRQREKVRDLEGGK